MKKLTTAVVITLSIMIGVHAQVTTSKIRGNVVDQSNQPLPGANVVATHTPSGTVYGATTMEDGRFAIFNMRIGGPYKVTVSFVGFQSKEYNDIHLTLGGTHNIDITLEESRAELEAIVVTAEGGRTAIIDKDRTGAATNIGGKELIRIPTIKRSASDYYKLEPSASSGGSFSGRNDQYNNFSLDGSIFNNPFGLDAATPGGQTDAQPISIDAIDQIQVAIAPYDVTLSGFTGASVNAVTKSGTNQWKGIVYGYYRNEKMTGGKVSKQDIFVPDLKQVQTGISIGGPIIKNKLFIFGNFELDDRDDLGSNYFANRGQGGDNVSRVTAADLDLVSSLLQTIKNADGSSYDPGAYEGFLHNTKSTKGILKLDWNINENHNLTAIYNFLDASRDLPGHPNALGRRGPDATTLQFANAGYQINNKIQSFLLELKSSFGNKYSNKFQVGYTHFDDFRNPFSTPAPVLNINKDGIRYIVAGHETFSIHNRLDQKVFQLTNNFNISLPNHTLTLGLSFEKFMFDNSFNLGTYQNFGDFNLGGTFGPGFTTVSDFETAVNNGDIQRYFDYAQTTYAKNNANDTWSLAESNLGQLAFYIQDEWDVKDNFKITYGLRADKPMYFDTKDKIQENIDRKGTYNPSIQYYNEDGNAVLLNSLELPEEKILWSPRLGFNWDVQNDASLQVRGGTGLFSGRFPFVWIGNQVANPDFFFYNTTAPDFKFPQVWRTNLGGDYKFENGWIASIDFAYTKDINAMMVRNYGLKLPGGTLQGVDNRPIYRNPDDRALNSGSPTNAYVFTNTDKGNSVNITLKAQKQWDNGLFASLAYNFLEAKDASSIEAEISSDAYDRNPAYGHVNEAKNSHSIYGDRHRIVGVTNKKFTYGSDDKWATTLSIFFEYSKGNRFSYQYSGDINGDGSSLNDLIYIPTASEINDMQFDESTTTAAAQRTALEAFIQQDDYLSENRGDYMEKYAILSPWRSRWDLRVLQDLNFSLKNGNTNTLQLSLDLLNVGNFINSNWGVVQNPVNTQPIGVTTDASGVPTYTFDVSQKNTYVDDFGLISRWQFQVGLRYIF